MRKPLVALVGRPNVGKSTLFNRLVGARRAITADLPGTTRDRVYADGEWQGREMTFVDTGGLTEPVRGREAEAELRRAVNAHVEEAIAEADVVLLVTDVQTGATGEDRRVADMLRRSEKPVFLVANKADNAELAQATADFWEYGFGDPWPVSALHGRGTGDLLDAIIKSDIPGDEPGEVKGPDVPAVAVVGRSNVGKSTLLNALAGADRVITSSERHTTRDVSRVTVDTPAGPMAVLDTAGVQRRKPSGRGVAKFSLLRTIRAINEADVVALMIDATEGPTLGDAHIGSYVLEAGKSLLLAVNKWDAVEKASDVQEQFFAQLEDRLGFLPSPPVVFVSAKTGEKLERLARAVYDVYRLSATEIETAELNRFLQSELGRLTTSSGRGGPRLYYATQVDTRPPTFRLFVNKPQLWQDNHRRFLSNAIREHYGLLGSPVRLQFKARRREAVGR